MATGTAVATVADALAEQSVADAWKAYQITEHKGIAFGKACYEYRAKHGAQGVAGQGLAQLLRKLEIKEGKAYYWIKEYEVSIGVRVRVEKIIKEAPSLSETAAMLPTPQRLSGNALVRYKMDKAADKAKDKAEADEDFWDNLRIKIGYYAPMSSGAAQQIPGDRGIRRGFLMLHKAVTSQLTTPTKRQATLTVYELENAALIFTAVAKKLRAQHKVKGVSEYRQTIVKALMNPDLTK